MILVLNMLLESLTKEKELINQHLLKLGSFTLLLNTDNWMKPPKEKAKGYQ